ncbi:MAG: M56 family metallopeptidase [Bacteroidota bacterium]
MNNLFIAGIISFEWVRALCWTLLHSVWQGMLAAAVAGIIILCTKHSKAVVRYNLLCIVFTGFIICSAYTFVQQLVFTGAQSTQASFNHVDRLPASAVSDVKKSQEYFWSLRKELFLRPLVYYTNRYASFIAGTWAIFFFIHFIKMFIGLRYVNRLRKRETFIVKQEWKERLFTISRMLGLRKVIGLKESALIKVPVVIGFLKPVILVPLGMFSNLSAEQVETIFVHELAHIRRRDFAVNLLQRFAESVFFFNPFITWISSRIREEREACCDDIVMDYTSDKKIYVEALVSFRQPDLALHGHAMALAGNNNLLNRVKRMITNENKKLNAMEKLTLIVVVLAITAFSFIPEKKNKITRNESLHPKVSVINPVNEIKAARANRFGSLVVAAPVSKKDTIPVPKQIQLKNISENFRDSEKETEVTAISGDGKKYYYKKIKNDITELYVDGVQIGRNDISRYAAVIGQIEKGIEDMRIQHIGKLQTQLTELKENKELFDQKELGLQDQQRQLLQSKVYDLQNDLELQSKTKNLLAEQDLLQEKNTLSLSLKNTDSKLALLSQMDYNLKQTPDEVDQIINDLATAGVIDDPKRFSFTLNNEELIVNGRKQSAELHETLRKKYILHKKDRYKCEVRPHSRSTDICKE